MKNLITLLLVLLLGTELYAQMKAFPINFHGVDVFAMMTPTQPYTQVGIAIVEPKPSATISKWLDHVMQQAPVPVFDAIITRDGVNVQFITYQTKQIERVGIISNLVSSEVDVYFLSIPERPYTVVVKKSMGVYDSTDDFYQIAEELLFRKFKVEYDAVIIGLHEVKYVLYSP